MSRIYPAQLQMKDISTGDCLLGEVYDIIYEIALNQQVETSETLFQKKADHYFSSPYYGFKVVEPVVNECLEIYYQEVLKQVESNITKGIRRARRIRFAMNDLSFLGYSQGPFVKKYAGYVFLAAVWAVHDGVIPERNGITHFLNETHHASISMGMHKVAKKYLAQS